MRNNELYGTIKLDGETVFFHNLSQDKDKLDIYNKAVAEEKITDFDQTTLTRLRKLYYGFISGLIYIYYEPTTFDNLANKAELLTHVFEDKSYRLVHGDTDSTRDIPFYMYGINHLDYNSWLEVKEGQKTWVYDLFSMLKIEKSVYYKLENPDITGVMSKDEIMTHPAREKNDYKTYHDGMNFMLIEMFPRMEKSLKTHPFRKILAPEITRFKKFVDFDNIILETHEILEGTKRNHTR